MQTESNAQKQARLLVEGEQTILWQQLEMLMFNAATAAGLNDPKGLAAKLKASGTIGWQPDGDGGHKFFFKVPGLPEGQEGTATLLAKYLAEDPALRAVPATSAEAHRAFLRRG